MEQPIQEKNVSSILVKLGLIVLILIGLFTTFASGYVLSTLLSKEKGTASAPKSSSSNTSGSVTSQSEDSTKFLPGKHYFEETIIAVTKDKPEITIAGTVTRIEQDTNYVQRSRLSYNDGKGWNRFSDSKKTADSTIVSDNLVKQWNTHIDSSRVLKQTVDGELSAGDSDIRFSTGNLENEITIRSLPGYTKFMSHGNGTISVNGETRDAYVLYTRIYSLNASEIQFYTDPFGLTTDWVAFWDEQGNFYHIDKTTVDKPTPTYQTHQIGVMDALGNVVSKTFSVDVTRDSQNPPVQYTIKLNDPVGVTLQFNRINGINKDSSGSFTWYMGNIQGTAEKDGQKIQGVGLVEYIHH
jgi:hypothetical protein